MDQSHKDHCLATIVAIRGCVEYEHRLRWTAAELVGALKLSTELTTSSSRSTTRPNFNHPDHLLARLFQKRLDLKELKQQMNDAESAAENLNATDTDHIDVNNSLLTNNLNR